MAEEATQKEDSPEDATAPAVAPEALKESTVDVPAVPHARFGLEAEFNTVWRVTVEMGVTPKDTLKEEFWRHVARYLRPGDTLRVIPDNMAWEQILHVAGQDKVWAHVVQKELYDLRTKGHGLKIPNIYSVEFAGAHHKWRVMRGGQMLKDFFETEALARRYAANHESAVDR